MSLQSLVKAQNGEAVGRHSPVSPEDWATLQGSSALQQAGEEVLQIDRRRNIGGSVGDETFFRAQKEGHGPENI